MPYIDEGATGTEEMDSAEWRSKVGQVAGEFPDDPDDEQHSSPFDPPEGER